VRGAGGSFGRPHQQHDAPEMQARVMAHDEPRKFDREDERIIKLLSQFASAGWRKAKDLGF
jgi:hypothetical protein